MDRESNAKEMLEICTAFGAGEMTGDEFHSRLADIRDREAERLERQEARQEDEDEGKW